jgi:DNA-binding NarL/FixJ family response regulator
MEVLIVDDHPLIREGLANVLTELGSEVTVHQSETADETRELLQVQTGLALILLDLGVPGAQGLSLLEEIRALRPETPVVVLSANDGRDTVLKAIDAGAMGFISKRTATGVLINALRLVLAGSVYVPPQVLKSVPESPPIQGLPNLDEKRPLTPADIGLTGRQADVLALLVQGKPNKIICRELSLAEGTVKTHIAAILRVLNVANRTQALFALSRLRVQLPAPAAPRQPRPN